SLGGGFGGVLLLRRDGHAKLLHDNRLPSSVEEAHVEERVVVPWYDGQSPARGPRQLALLQSVNPTHAGVRIHARRGGPPTGGVLKPGDLFILDFSVVIGGYRSDFTNTLVVGREPTAEQRRLYDLSCQAMAAGEKTLQAGQACRTVYGAVREVFEK